MSGGPLNTIDLSMFQCGRKSLLPLLTRLLLISCVLLLAGCKSATSLLFYPSQQYFNDPADHGISYQEVTLKTNDGEILKHWYFDTDQPVKGYVVFFHGNAENISTHFASVFWLPKAGYEVLLVDYRGFGLSSGVPTLPEVFHDMQLSYNYLFDKAEGKPVYVLSQSIGAALSVVALSDTHKLHGEPQCMVLDAGFAGFRDMARSALQNGWLTWPVAYPASWLLPDEYEPRDYAAKISFPVLQMHSSQDQIVPYEQGKRLFEAFQASGQGQVTWQDVLGPHIMTFHQKENRQRVLEYWQGGCS
jgi:alpha-beta hydrolase superfamily lysophospholipase